MVQGDTFVAVSRRDAKAAGEVEMVKRKGKNVGAIYTVGRRLILDLASSTKQSARD